MAARSLDTNSSLFLSKMYCQNSLINIFHCGLVFRRGQLWQPVSAGDSPNAGYKCNIFPSNCDVIVLCQIGSIRPAQRSKVVVTERIRLRGWQGKNDSKHKSRCKFIFTDIDFLSLMKLSRNHG